MADDGYLIHPDDFADFSALIRWWRTGQRPTRLPGKDQPGPRPNIRAILLEDLETGGEVQAAVTRRERVDEVQEIKLEGTISGGTFTLTFDGQTTSPIAYNASADTLKAALEALSNLNAGDIEVTAYPGRWLVQFTGQYAGQDVPLMTPSNILLGSDPRAIRISSALAWVDANREETIHGQIPVGTPTPIVAGAVVTAGWIPEGACYGVLNVECRDFTDENLSYGS